MNYDAVLSIVRGVRELVLPHFGSAPVLSQKTEKAADVVTELDIRAEAYLAKELAELEPSVRFFGEERGGEVSERFWLCDPIDGTAHFIRGLPLCSSMLSHIENGQVVFTAIYDFVNDHMYHAIKGKGAYCDGAPIRVNTRPLREAYCVVETHIEKEENRALYLELRKRAGGLPAFYNCGFDFSMIASGRLEGRILFDPFGQDWDYAPSLLVSEAGGIVANIGKRTYDYRNHNFIAANPIVYKDLTEGPNALFPIS